MITVAAVVCTRNRPTELRSAVSSLLATEMPPEMLVVVDASDPEKRHEIEIQDFAKSEIVIEFSEPGLTRQRNAALERLGERFDVIAFFDDDVTVGKEYLRLLRKYFEDDDEVVGVGGRTPDTVTEPPSRWRRLFLLDSTRSGALLRSGINVPFREMDQTYEVDWLPGCSMAYRASAIVDMRFDEWRTGVGWGEDADFSGRAASRGRLLISDSLPIVHHKAQANRDSPAVQQFQEISGQLRMIKHGPKQVKGVPVLWSILGRQILGAVRMLLPLPQALGTNGRARQGTLGSVSRRTKVHDLAQTGLRVPSRTIFYLRSVRSMKSSQDFRDFVCLEPSAGVTVQLTGGLGNQLFGVAAGFAQAKRLGTGLHLDLSEYSEQNPRFFELAALGSDRIHLGIYNTRRLLTFRETSLEYDSRVERVVPGTLLRGYFQSWMYFRHVENDLRNLLTNAIGIAEGANHDGRFIGVQVRRGDFLQLEPARYHGLCAPSFFVESVKLLRSELGNLPAVIFSDGLEDCRDLAESIGNASLDFGPQGALSVMSRLASADALVVSNSSFGWWSAWLARDKPVVAPNPWYRNFHPQTLLPPSWRQLPKGIMLPLAASPNQSLGAECE